MKSSFKEQNQASDQAKQAAHNRTFMFFQRAELDAVHARECQGCEQYHPGYGGGGKNRGQKSKTCPSVANARHINREKTPAWRTSQKGKKAGDCGAIGGLR